MIRFKQLDPYGCGLYSVAHALNLKEDFVTKERIEASKKGNNIGQLSRWMQQHGLDYYLNPIWYDSFMKETSLSEDLKGMKVTANGDESLLACPLIIDVNVSKLGLGHMIGAHLDINGNLHVYDSLKEDVLFTSMSEVENHYHLVFGVYAFYDVESGALVTINS